MNPFTRFAPLLKALENMSSLNPEHNITRGSWCQCSAAVVGRSLAFPERGCPQPQHAGKQADAETFPSAFLKRDAVGVWKRLSNPTRGG